MGATTRLPPAPGRRGTECGSAAIQFVGITVIAVVMTMTTIHLGMAMYHVMLYQSAAQDAARVIAVCESQVATPVNNATTYTDAHCEAEGSLRVSTHWAPLRGFGATPPTTTVAIDRSSPAARAHYGSVIITGTYDFALPLMGTISIPIRSSGRFVIERELFVQ